MNNKKALISISALLGAAIMYLSLDSEAEKIYSNLTSGEFYAKVALCLVFGYFVSWQIWKNAGKE